jgi:hypothetical protein
MADGPAPHSAKDRAGAIPLDEIDVSDPELCVPSPSVKGHRNLPVQIPA